MLIASSVSGVQPNLISIANAIFGASAPPLKSLDAEKTIHRRHARTGHLLRLMNGGLKVRQLTLFTISDTPSLRVQPFFRASDG